MTSILEETLIDILADIKDNQLRLRCINGILNIKPVAHNAIEIEIR